MEIRNFACALAAIERPQGEVIAYEAVHAWVTGLGFVQLSVRAEHEPRITLPT
jgi:protocatechuate 4,5-dioxygenase beta chain